MKLESIVDKLMLLILNRAPQCRCVLSYYITIQLL